MSKRIKQACLWCGREFEAYISSNRKFCCPDCHYKHESKELNPVGYTRHPHLSDFNRVMNPKKMTPMLREKLRNTRLGNGVGRSYEKTYGQHTHRVVAEKMLGRALSHGEVVHHIDGDIHNNSPENLCVLPSQREHAKLHAMKAGGIGAK